ncbi:cobyrinic acid a,c-diamide synthase [Paludisphaera mucosa]|uniref:Cobyrinic acid a,c-diamide synthase n=1 Tax=Paludisphaera mucosa TaxID=3030827 RepID=A0ABT6FKA4_9BACT|nr:cobyrinic acid a,c-diamide synthase [Paludisphaera mucosa]MDG3008007.1 cobyrinic acid a,c-diamide synthase [Paludisphaera mucosa]
MTTPVPRIALATSTSGPDPSIAGLALIAGLTARRWRVQHFRTRACPTATEVVAHATGMPGRHLDTWLMPPDVCRTLLAEGVRTADLGVVEGRLDSPGVLCEAGLEPAPGDLGPLVHILDLPVVSVVPAAGFRDGTFHLPDLPRDAAAVILDGLESPDDLDRLRRLIRLTSGLPVVGAVDLLPGARREIEAAPPGAFPREAVDALAASFLRHADLKAIETLATSRSYPEYVERPGRRRPVGSSGFRVAYARDAAFGCYFPDTFEALAALGAQLVEFSPLNDGALPDGVDLVMIGCGLADVYAGQLASNVSMLASLRQHVCRGQRIYTEGGGSAYLGRSIIVDGERIPGAGILPVEAERAAVPRPPEPVVRTLSRDSWLGPRGSKVRGYRSGRWNLKFSPTPFECPSCYGRLSGDGDFYFRHHAVGSFVHLHLAALPEVVSAFAGPHHPSLRRPTTIALPDETREDEAGPDA